MNVTHTHLKKIKLDFKIEKLYSKLDNHSILDDSIPMYLRLKTCLMRVDNAVYLLLVLNI